MWARYNIPNNDILKFNGTRWRHSEYCGHMHREGTTIQDDDVSATPDGSPSDNPITRQNMILNGSGGGGWVQLQNKLETKGEEEPKGRERL